MPPKLLLIGGGQIAEKAHLPVLQQLHQEGVIELCGVCDLNEDRAKGLAQRFKIERHGSDWQKIARECGAQAVGICLPPGPNVEVAVAAMSSGLHVLCEKPPGRDFAQAQKLAQAAMQHPDLIGAIAFNRRYAPFYLEAMQRSQKLGSPHTFYGRFTRAAAGQAPSNTVMDWLSSDGSHALDLAIATMGFPRRVSATHRGIGDGPDNIWTIHLDAEQGGSVLVFDFAAGRRVERFEWSGPGYDVLLELPLRGVWAQAGAEPDEWHFSPSNSTEFATGYGFAGEYAALAQAIQGQAPRPKADFTYAPHYFELIQTLLECPSGQSRELSVPDTKLLTASKPVQATNSTVASSSRTDHQPPANRRPIVQITQNASHQSLYFPTQKLTQLSELSELHLSNHDDAYEERLEHTEVLITGWNSRYPTPAELERAHALKLAIVLGVSVKNLCPDLLLERGVLICNTGEIIARSVAEHCLLMSLAGIRGFSDIDRRMHQGEWPPLPPTAKKPADIKGRVRHTVRAGARRLKNNAHRVPCAQALKPAIKPLAEKLRSQIIDSSSDGNQPTLQRHDLRDQTVGIIGWGNIARHYARLLQPFGCRLLVYSSYADDAELESLNARRAALGEVLGSCRVVSLHQGLTDRSRNSLGATELSLLRPGTVLVNTARAEIFNETALIERLKRGDVVAALDVFHQEPLPETHPFRSMKNVVLSPHNSNHTPECYLRAGTQTLDWVFDWLAGNSIPHLSAEQIANMT